MTEGEIVVKKVLGHVPKGSVPREKPMDSNVVYRLTRDDISGGPVNLDEIEPGLWLGNVTAAADLPTLEKLAIRSVLTIDSCPLPTHITENPSLRTKYIQASDVPREDLIRHFEDTNKFIRESLAEERNVLVHCYFGVSRSATIVIAYLMDKYKLGYEAALHRVKSKRRFVMPNPGFINQLKLFGIMNYRIDPLNEKYKLFRLKLAADNVRKAKRLPVNCMDVVKPDPAVTQETPEPIVYRCRKCRRVVATKSNLLTHKPKPPGQSPAKYESFGDLACGGIDSADERDEIEALDEKKFPTDAPADSEATVGPTRDVESSTNVASGKESLSYITEQMRRNSIGSDHSNRSSEKDGVCSKIYFTEPLAWMTDIFHNTQGRLYCPKCTVKLGSFNWVMATKCPCGAEIYPAFYLVPSKTEYSTAVQNVQVTV
ncbi:dual specificity protein phosphatase MPK-4 [Toxorhynchites rutilus septentrionalis]|uniref:dual specificity protein phosphatase MPK-4 n=1 Tax=Toxorhynchites rutilus septentrionalis TaxID=329112 RepID=UPI0024786265|nr:dual specificity protein phosphatase MPK-4 [Toxorhynchites rutilus septentrionalis]XP_055636548.1 dual specificity protein phosphatase MPK-4 [Toxorhynchites rutilus septentrionalis]